jgi:hypothetical protein
MLRIVCSPCLFTSSKLVLKHYIGVEKYLRYILLFYLLLQVVSSTTSWQGRPVAVQSNQVKESSMLVRSRKKEVNFNIFIRWASILDIKKLLKITLKNLLKLKVVW